MRLRAATPQGARKAASPGPGAARAIAHANIALIKYWGKLDTPERLAAVPSLSMTLGALSTRTSVNFSPGATAGDDDEVELDGRAATGPERARVVEVLDAVRSRGQFRAAARVETANNFPTAAGLASSASGFAALALAGLAAAGLKTELEVASDLARSASVSAARSLHGGFVALEAGARSALSLGQAGLPLQMSVALTQRGPKQVSSREGMLRTQKTSPLYPAWVQAAPELYRNAREALAAFDLQRLGQAMERSTLLMHACMMGAQPDLLYWAPATVSLMGRVKQLRNEGVEAYFTMDAGPHVKVLSSREEGPTVRAALSEVPGVLEVIESDVGGPAHLEGAG